MSNKVKSFVEYIREEQDTVAANKLKTKTVDGDKGKKPKGQKLGKSKIVLNPNITDL